MLRYRRKKCRSDTHNIREVYTYAILTIIRQCPVGEQERIPGLWGQSIVLHYEGVATVTRKVKWPTVGANMAHLSSLIIFT